MSVNHQNSNSLQPEIVSRLSRLDLVARLVVEGFITGLHRSPYHGFSVEFSEYRPYMPGDAIRNVDWKVWGRTDRFYVKQFEEETNLKCYLLLDGSGSMGYGSGPVSKLQYAVHLSAALTYLMLKQRDAVGLITFDEAIRTYHPPRSVMSYLHVLLKTLDTIQSTGQTGVAHTFHEMAERIKRRGLVIVLSDLMDDSNAILNALKHFRHKKHEVIVFHVLDPQEKELNFKGNVIFVDMESGEKIETQPDQFRSVYRQMITERIAHFKSECHAHRIDYVPLMTSQPYDVALMQYLMKRSRGG